MACSETSFKSYSFTHQWKVSDLEVRLHNPDKLTSPEFCSPPGMEPETKWKLAVFLDYREAVAKKVAGKVGPKSLSSLGKNYISVEIVYVGAKGSMLHKDIWIEAQLRKPLIINMPVTDFKGSVTCLGQKKLSAVARTLPTLPILCQLQV